MPEATAADVEEKVKQAIGLITELLDPRISEGGSSAKDDYQYLASYPAGPGGRFTVGQMMGQVFRKIVNNSLSSGKKENYKNVAKNRAIGQDIGQKDDYRIKEDKIEETYRTRDRERRWRSSGRRPNSAVELA